MQTLTAIKWLFIFHFRQKAQEEAIELMMPGHNLLKACRWIANYFTKQRNGFGTFYLTSMDESARKEEVPAFADKIEALLALQLGKIKLREPVQVRVDGHIVETTCGRLMFNEQLPPEIGFINEAIKASGIKRIITRAIKQLHKQTL
jgi:DNA-directed RNA polymerase subunit beta'